MSDAAPAAGARDDAEPVRLDVWLWRARFFRTRALAVGAVGGGVRINGARTDKPGARVRPGDVLTFAQGSAIRVIEVAAPGVRRGPAPEAAALFIDRTPPAPPDPVTAPARDGGRPTKRDRRRIDALRGDP